MHMKVLLDCTFPHPIKVKMVTTSGGNREAGVRVEIYNMIERGSGALLDRSFNQKLWSGSVVNGVVSGPGDDARYEVQFIVQRIGPTRITAISQPELDFSDTTLPMPALGNPVEWMWWSLKVEHFDIPAKPKAVIPVIYDTSRRSMYRPPVGYKYEQAKLGAVEGAA